MQQFQSTSCVIMGKSKDVTPKKGSVILAYASSESEFTVSVVRLTKQTGDGKYMHTYKHGYYEATIQNHGVGVHFLHMAEETCISFLRRRR